MRIGIGDCSSWCPLVPLPNSILGASCADCGPGYLAAPLDTGDISQLPLTSVSAADLIATAPAVGVALACPSGQVCSYLAGIPDMYVYGGMVALAIAGFVLLRGLAK